MRVSASARDWPLREPFVIARSSRTHIPIVTVILSDTGVTGCGECQPNARFGESVSAVLAALEPFKGRDVSIAELEEASKTLPSKALRNALDCALLDWMAKSRGVRVWELLNLSKPKPAATVFTLSLGTPENMAAAARRAVASGKTRLKLKLGATEDQARITAVRNAAPKADLVIDANEGWSPNELNDLLAHAWNAGVRMVEQPLSAANDGALKDKTHPMPLCADESFFSDMNPADLADRYDWINIKLDKVGGLRPALDLCAKAQAAGLGYMVGCMVCTSLGAAAATVLTANARLVDLDGPLLLSEDRRTPIAIDGAYHVHPPKPSLWG